MSTFERMCRREAETHVALGLLWTVVYGLVVLALVIPPTLFAAAALGWLLVRGHKRIARRYSPWRIPVEP